MKLSDMDFGDIFIGLRVTSTMGRYGLVSQKTKDRDSTIVIQWLGGSTSKVSHKKAEYIKIIER